MFGVLRHINRLAIVLDRKLLFVACDLNVLDGVRGLTAAEPYHLVVSVDQKLINQLVETWIHWNCCCLEAASPRGVVGHLT